MIINMSSKRVKIYKDSRLVTFDYNDVRQRKCVYSDIASCAASVKNYWPN